MIILKKFEFHFAGVDLTIGIDAVIGIQPSSVVVTSPKLTLMVTLIGEVHSNFGIRNSVCRLLRILLRRI